MTSQIYFVRRSYCEVGLRLYQYEPINNKLRQLKMLKSVCLPKGASRAG